MRFEGINYYRANVPIECSGDGAASAEIYFKRNFKMQTSLTTPGI
jgi:hypothetical protein